MNYCKSEDRSSLDLRQKMATVDYSRRNFVVRLYFHAKLLKYQIMYGLIMQSCLDLLDFLIYKLQDSFEIRNSFAMNFNETQF